MVKIVCLGNEFVEGDSLAVEIGEKLKSEGFDVLHIKDSFSLMEFVSKNSSFVILDVVDSLEEVCWIGVRDLKVNSVLSAHDLDAGFVLGLLGEEVKILGMPRFGDLKEVFEEVREKLVKSFI